MQHQVGIQNLTSNLNEDGGVGWNLHLSTNGSGSWTSIAKQEATSSSSVPSVGKSDSASDAGDDASSVKSGSAISSISNITTQQSQEPGNLTSGALTNNSSSPWSASTNLPGIESGPWGNSNSPAPTSMGNFGWNTPSSLSLSSNNPGISNNMQPSVGGSMSFNPSIGNNSSGWGSGISNNPLSTSSVPPSLNSGLQSGTMSSQWQGSNNMIGNIGDFPKSTSEPNWNNSPMIDSSLNKENNADTRMWGMPSEKPPDAQWDPSKPQWGNLGSLPIGAGGDQGANNRTELSFAEAAIKGIKPPPAKHTPPILTAKNEEILRAIENHEGWGSRPINQETTWDVETSPKSHRKFSAENSPAQASNVWNNKNGTAIWDSVRDNNSWSGPAPAAGKPWNGDKEQSGWGAMPKPAQDSWGPGNVSNTGPADSKSFGMWGGPGAGGDASSKMWGQKPEVRSWGMGDGNNGRPGALSSWGDDADSSGWDDRRAQAGMSGPGPGMIPPSPGIGGPTLPGVAPQGMPGMNNMQGMGPDNGAAWNDVQKSGWNSAGAGAMPRPKIDEPWNKPPPKITGWGDPVQDSSKMDDGTSLWGAGNMKQMPPSQPKPGGWGDTSAPQGQWNAAVGTKPKIPAGWDEASYAMAQRAKSGGYPNDVSGNSVEVGYWNGLPQDNNTWNDPAALKGVRKITGQLAPPKYVNNNTGHPTQMRAKLLQQLMDMGFRKEEAQTALITNNMNLEIAINELKSNNGMSRKDLDIDMYQPNGAQSRMPPYMPKSGLGNDDFTDPTRPDQVPNFNMTMQNTPFSNAQIPNQPFMANSASLPPSSLNSSTSSINSNVHMKMIQKMQVAPPGNSTGSRQMPQASEQAQQHIIAQLRMAVSSGIISPQLLNHTLPRNMLVLLQQLLQLQSTRQSLIARSRQGTRQQMDQNNSMLNNVNQQMMSLQKQLQQAQTVFFSSQKPPNMSQQPPSGIMSLSGGQQPGGALAENIDAISSDLANASISNQSRLTTQWKGPDTTPSAETAPYSPGFSSSSTADSNFDKSTQPNSANYMNLIGGGLGITGDQTWSSVSASSSSSQNWPSTSTDTINTNASDLKGSASTSSSATSGLSVTDVIPEFIPGKPWQGLTKSSVEDDPHMTPGSIQRSLSVNRVHDDSLNSLNSSKLDPGKSWSSSSSRNENSLGLGHLGNKPPPGVAPPKMFGSQPWQQGGNPVFSRQSSWAGRSGNSAFTQVGASNWNDSQGPGSSWILLKNLTYMDSVTTRVLCQRHGDVINFYHIPETQAALIQYSSRDVAAMAQKSLNNFNMGSTTLKADFINDADAQRVISQMSSHNFQQNMAPVNASQWSQAPPSGYQHSGGNRGGEIWSQVSNPWSGPGLWGDTSSSAADQNCNPLLSNLGGILDA